MRLLSSRSRRLVAWALGILLALMLAFSVLAGSLASSLLSRVLGLPVSIGWTSVSLLGQHAKFRDVVVSNPEGFGGGDFLRSPEVRIELRLETLIDGPVFLPSIEIRGLTARLTTVRGHGNYEVVLANLAPAESADPGNTTTEIGQVQIEDITAHVQMFSKSIGNAIPDGMKNLGLLEVRIPKIVLKNIGSQSGGDAAARQAASLVTRAILVAVARKTRDLPLSLSLAMLAQASHFGGTVLDIVGKAQHTGVLVTGVERAAGEAVGAIESLAERAERLGRSPER